MSAQTIHELDLTTEALTRPGRPQLLQVPRQRSATSHLALVPDLAPARRGSTAAPAVRVTPRGRLVLVLVLMVVTAVLALGLAGRVGAAATAPSSSVPTRTVVVQPGQTLWSIAGQVAPAADRSTTIARLVQLNRLPSTDVAAGVRLVVPAG